MTDTIRNHPNFNPDDFAYLSAKGWTAAAILARWDAEHAEGKGPCRWDSCWAKAKLAATLRAAH